MLLFVPMRVQHTGSAIMFVRGGAAIEATSIHACLYDHASGRSEVMPEPMSIKEAGEWLCIRAANFTDNAEELVLVFVSRLDIEAEAFTSEQYTTLLAPLAAKKMPWWTCMRATLMSHPGVSNRLKTRGWTAETLTRGNPTLLGIIEIIREFDPLTFLTCEPLSLSRI